MFTVESSQTLHFSDEILILISNSLSISPLPEINKVDAVNLMAHVFNSVIMIIDLMIVGHPIKLGHAYWTMGIGLVYSIFSAIFFLAGGTTRYVYILVFSSRYLCLVWSLLRLHSAQNRSLLIKAVWCITFFFLFVCSFAWPLETLKHTYSQKHWPREVHGRENSQHC